MEAILNPKESAKFIAENSKDVYIEDGGVQKVAEMLFDKVTEKEFSVAGWKSSHELNPQEANEDAVNWVFVADVLNFSFWSEHEDHKCLVKYKGKTYSGYWSLCAAINRALDEAHLNSPIDFVCGKLAGKVTNSDQITPEQRHCSKYMPVTKPPNFDHMTTVDAAMFLGTPITSASYYATMTLDQVKHAFRSDTEVPMPLIEERHHVLNEAGTILLEKFGGSYFTCVKESGKSAQKLLQIILENFPSFRDEATFQSRKVAFYKRAQILVADTWSVLEGKEDGCFSDISKISIFADYRIPQVLVYLGAMRYSEELMNKLNKGHMFQFGDNQEVEIRGCSIWCCELICSSLLELYKKKGDNMSEKINAILLDYYLWDYARDHREDMKGVPFHHVRSIYY